MHKYLLVILCALISINAHAIPCFLTIAKDSCWTKYNVKVTVYDTEKNVELGSVVVSKDSNWQRQPFACEPGQKLRFEAKFAPVFWQGDQGKIFNAKQFVSLPSAPKPNETAWDIALCYPSEFSEVPLPPDAIGNCACDMKAIPPVKPQLG